MVSDKSLTEKELMKRKKKLLLEEFEKDRDILKKLKTNDSWVWVHDSINAKIFVIKNTQYCPVFNKMAHWHGLANNSVTNSFYYNELCKRVWNFQWIFFLHGRKMYRSLGNLKTQKVRRWNMSYLFCRQKYKFRLIKE